MFLGRYWFTYQSCLNNSNSLIIIIGLHWHHCHYPLRMIKNHHLYHLEDPHSIFHCIFYCSSKLHFCKVPYIVPLKWVWGGSYVRALREAYRLSTWEYQNYMQFSESPPYFFSIWYLSVCWCNKSGMGPFSKEILLTVTSSRKPLIMFQVKVRVREQLIT